MQVTRTLARFIADCREESFPDAMRYQAKRALLNVLGCAVGAARHDTVERAISALVPFFGRGEATLWGRTERADALHAALLNGIAAHVLDFDDTHPHAIHPSAPVWPAILAAGSIAARAVRPCCMPSCSARRWSCGSATWSIPPTNDVVVKSDGCIYFTDPWTSPSAPEQWDLTVAGVYRITPDLGTMSLLASDFVLPNGLAFTPDEKGLYINDSRRHIRAFELLPNGTLAKQTDRIFADLQGPEPGVPDGMKVDVEGTSTAGERGASGSWIRVGRSWAASSTGLAPPPTSPSAATTGEPCTSPAGTTWARSR